MDRYTRPDWFRSALITIDMQNDFTWPGAKAYIPGTARVVPKIAALAYRFRSKGLPVFHIIRLYRADGSNADLCRREMVESGVRVVSPETYGSTVVDALVDGASAEQKDGQLLEKGYTQLSNNDWIVYKPRWGAFYETSLNKLLRQQQVTTVVVCGCNFPNCPRTSIYEASERDFKIVAIHDAISCIYKRGIQELTRIGVYVCSTNEAESCLENL